MTGTRPVRPRPLLAVAALAVAAVAACGGGDRAGRRTLTTDDSCGLLREQAIAASLNVAPRSKLSLEPFHDNIPIFTGLPGVEICKFTAASPGGVETRAYVGLVPGLGREALSNWKEAVKNAKRVVGVGSEAWWSPPVLAVRVEDKVVALGLYGSVVPDRSALERARRIVLTGLEQP